VYCACVWLFIVYGLFTLHLLDDDVILIININNTYILFLNGLKIFITDSPPLSVIQQLESEKVPSKINLIIER
jgi:hypothetical protein